MIDAGIPINKALRSIEKAFQKKEREKLLYAIALVERGVSLPDSLIRSKLIDSFDHAMLITADEAGRVSDGLNHLSELRLKQLQRADSLNASLVLPKAIVLIGAFAGIFVRTAAGGESVSEAVFSVTLIAATFYFICYLFLVITRADTRIWMSWFWPNPVIFRQNKWCALALEYMFYNSLVWQISAGVAYSMAVERCSSLLRSPRFNASVKKASKEMAAGSSLTQSLLKHGLVNSNRMRQVLLVADQSGKHEAAIKHELRLQAGQLSLKAKNFFKWMPRVFYVLALVFVSKQMAF